MRTKRPAYLVAKPGVRSLTQKVRYAASRKPTTSRLVRAAIKLLGDHRLGDDLHQLLEDEIESARKTKPVA